MNKYKAVQVSAHEVLKYWFSPASAKRWFRPSSAFDDELRQRFADTVQAALSGELDSWSDSPSGALALVLLLDQLPLNIYRGLPESFSGEARAREIAAMAIERGWDSEMETRQKAFLYLPFMHSESLADQERGVELYRQAEMADNLRWAEHHRGIVQRFGRFPHRNAILGRTSTEEELAWLASGKAFRG